MPITFFFFLASLGCVYVHEGITDRTHKDNDQLSPVAGFIPGRQALLLTSLSLRVPSSGNSSSTVQKVFSPRISAFWLTDLWYGPDKWVSRSTRTVTLSRQNEELVDSGWVFFFLSNWNFLVQLSNDYLHNQQHAPHTHTGAEHEHGLYVQKQYICRCKSELSLC